MEYLANCNVCNRHTIIQTVKVIKRETTRKPQRVTKCVRCGKTTRATIIGDVVKVKKLCYVLKDDSPESEFITTEKEIYVFKLWV